MLGSQQRMSSCCFRVKNRLKHYQGQWYVLSCNPQEICWNPYTQNLCEVNLFGDRVLADVQVQMRSIGWALIHYDWCSKKKKKKEENFEIDTDIHRRRVILRWLCILKQRLGWCNCKPRKVKHCWVLPEGGK